MKIIFIFWIIFLLFFGIFLHNNLSANEGIGDVILQEGTSVIQRKDGTENTSEIDLDVFSYDTIKTGKGKTAIQFVDDTRVDVTQHSKLVIDEFVYDPSTKTGSLTMKASLGTVRYASGLIAKNSKQNVKIKTPTATIGVRGTDFSMTIDELGGSTIILLPSCDTNGNCFVGEITVDSDVGQVILNQAFQATFVATTDSQPMRPVLLDLDESLINNLLIVSRPKELDEELTSKYYENVANMLDVDFLEFKDLEIDYLEEDVEQWATGLNIDFLEQNFLVDLLKVINEQLAQVLGDKISKQETQRVGSGDPSKVRVGLDPETGILVENTDPSWTWTRESASGNIIRLVLDQKFGYLMNILQGDYEIIDYELGGIENAIVIRQSN